MKPIVKILILLFCISVQGNLFAQLNRANKKYENFQYSQAIPLFEEVVQEDSTDFESWTKLAECYRLTNKTQLAEKAYSKIVNRQESPAINKFYYAQMLLTNEKIMKAKQWFIEYTTDEPGDKRGKEFIDAITSREKMTSDSNRYSFKKININSDDADFGAVPYKDGIVFSSSRLFKGGNQEKDLWTGSRFMSIYFAKGTEDKFSEPVLFAEPIQIKYNNGPICFNRKGDEMYFTRNSIEGGDEEGNVQVDKLKIFSIYMENGKYSEPKAFQYNDDKYSCAHPVLSRNGNKIYFASDMPGTLGGMDIWVCEKEGEDGWSTPENLGPNINTLGNELFPTVDDDDNIYFSSNGLSGIGGLDVFQTKFDGVGYIIPKNVGAPVNSPDDDFSFNYNVYSRGGYFSSNRSHQEYNDDIYAFTSNEVMIAGHVFDKLTKTGIEKAKIRIIEEGFMPDKFVTNKDGNFQTYLIPLKNYTFIAEYEDYHTDTIHWRMDSLPPTDDTVAMNIEMESNYSKNSVFVMNNILYDIDKSNIRVDAAKELDNIVMFMKDNKRIKIELSSHTDCRATEKYNQKLSEKRAQSAIDYLISKGIESDRLVAKGYGESKPVNGCKCSFMKKSTCSEEEHQANRRTEIKILE